MYIEIPTVARCCFCAPLRYGILLWAYLKLVTSILALAFAFLFTFIGLYIDSDAIPMLLLILVIVISLGVDIAFNFILIIGSHKKNLALLTKYYRYAFAHAIVFVLLGLLWTGFVIATEFNRLSQPKLVAYIVDMSLIIIIPLILHIYLFIVLRSEMRKLKIRERLHLASALPESVAQAENGSTADYQTDEKRCY